MEKTKRKNKRISLNILFDIARVSKSGYYKWLSKANEKDEDLQDYLIINEDFFDNNHIQSIKSSDQHIVSTADGTPSPVFGEGSISLTKNLNLDSVLIVPSLNHNLLSVA